MAHKPRASSALPERRPCVRCFARAAPRDVPQHLQSDLGADRLVTEAELDAIERLLGDELRAFLGPLH